MKTVAIIPAAGEGRRIGGGTSKPYLLLGKKPILARTLEIFESCNLIEEVVVVIGRSDRERCRRMLRKYRLKKVKEIVRGGVQRSGSVYRGLKRAKRGCGIVIIHDGVRPFVNGEIIKRAVEGAKKYGACAVGVPAIDTVKKVRAGAFVEKTLQRKELWLIQTPQAFRYPLLCRAYVRAKKNGFAEVTDDSSLVEMLGEKVKLIKGSYDNLKITTPQDLLLAEVILKRRKGYASRDRI